MNESPPSLNILAACRLFDMYLHIGQSAMPTITTEIPASLSADVDHSDNYKLFEMAKDDRIH